MPRVKRGIVSKRKHNKLHLLTKGYRGTKGRLIRTSHEALLHAGSYAYHGRKRRKQDFRVLWITRISEAAQKHGLSYSKLMHKFKQAHIELDRKILSELITTDEETFKHLVDSVKNIQ